MKFINSIYYKVLVTVYKLNENSSDTSKNVIVNAIWQALIIGKDGIDKAMLEMALETATEDWIDFWGNFYGIPRYIDEVDGDYRERIIEEIIAPKSTIPALKMAAARRVNLIFKEKMLAGEVRVFEPWTQLLKLDTRGRLDSKGRLIDYNYWNYGVVDLSLPDSSYLTPELIAYLNKIKAAGVKLVFSIAPRWDIVVDERELHVWYKIDRETMMIAFDPSNAFGTLPDVSDMYHVIAEIKSRLDKDKVLEGKRKIYWNGIELTRSFYGTGPIREYRAGILSLLDIANILGIEEPTIEEAAKLEEEYQLGTRENEGRLAIKQKHIEIKTERINNGV